MILLSAEEARVFDAQVRARLNVSERELIERAGAAAFAVLDQRFTGSRLVVLHGKGHNGADGLVLARLAAETGVSVTALSAFPLEALAPETRNAVQSAQAAGVRWSAPLDDDFAAKTRSALAEADAAVDALVGIGARPPLRGNLASAVRALQEWGGFVAAMDMPSGLDPDTGEAGNPCVCAALTVTFLAQKLCLWAGDGPEAAGEVVLAALGSEALEAAHAAELYEPEDAARALRPRPRSTHKRRAEVLVVAGSREYLGAALLCARAAYRGGGGLVRLLLPEALAPFAQTALPEGVVVGLPAEAALGEEHADAVERLSRTAHAAVVGPGLGRRAETGELVRRLWRTLPIPAVFDADALFFLASAPDAKVAARILTPHQGECERLLGAFAEGKGAPERVRRLARQTGAVALLKGPSTLVGDPEGGLSVHALGTRALATAGTGDVLAGLVGALLAQGHAPLDAARLGAHLHGAASRKWSAVNGMRGLLASELADLLPAAIRDLELLPGRPG